MLERLTEIRWKLHCFFIRNTGFKPGSKDDIRFLSLALCGEAGELANMIKKEWRGDTRNMSATEITAFYKKLDDEIGDVFSYWANLVLARGGNLEEEMKRSLEKAAQKAQEWGFTPHHP